MDTFSKFEKLIVLLAAAIGWSHDAVGLTLLNFLAEPIMNEFNVGTLEVGFIFSAQYIFCNIWSHAFRRDGRQVR